MYAVIDTCPASSITRLLVDAGTRQDVMELVVPAVAPECRLESRRLPSNWSAETLPPVMAPFSIAADSFFHSTLSGVLSPGEVPVSTSLE